MIRRIMLAALMAIGLATMGVQGLANASTAAPATCSDYWDVLDNPTPVYYSDWSFYKFKHPGDTVVGPSFFIEPFHNGAYFVPVYLAVGGQGWINLAKVAYMGCY